MADACSRLRVITFYGRLQLYRWRKASTGVFFRIPRPAAARKALRDRWSTVYHGSNATALSKRDQPPNGTGSQFCFCCGVQSASWPARFLFIEAIAQPQPLPAGRCWRPISSTGCRDIALTMEPRVFNQQGSSHSSVGGAFTEPAGNAHKRPDTPGREAAAQPAAARRRRKRAKRQWPQPPHDSSCS